MNSLSLEIYTYKGYIVGYHISIIVCKHLPLCDFAIPISFFSFFETGLLYYAALELIIKTRLAELRVLK